MDTRRLEVTVTHDRTGDRIFRGDVTADPYDGEQIDRIFRGLVRGDGWDLERMPEFTMEIRLAGDRSVLTRVSGGG